MLTSKPNGPLPFISSADIRPILCIKLALALKPALISRTLRYRVGSSQQYLS